MNQKIITSTMSFILCIALFILEIAYLILFNVSRGINKNGITKLIDNIDIKEELKRVEAYNDLNVDNKVLEDIFNSKEVEEYVKENIKAFYLNICYNENRPYIESDKLREYVNTKIEKQQEEYGITEENLENILNITDEIIEKVETELNEKNISKEETKIVREILSKKPSDYILIGIIIVSIIILSINKSYEGLIWLALPTLISGGLFFLLALSVDGTINTVDIDINIYEFINSYFKTLLKTIKVSSITFLFTGMIESISYVILKFRKSGENNGNDWFIQIWEWIV